MQNVIQVRNPRTLLLPDVAGLIRHGVETITTAAPDGFDSVAQDFYIHTTNPMYFLLLGYEKGTPLGFVTGQFPASRLFPYPMITLMYNEGTSDLRRALVEAAANTVAERGFKCSWALNGSGRSDEAWLRVMVPKGCHGRKVASVLEIRG